MMDQSLVGAIGVAAGSLLGYAGKVATDLVKASSSEARSSFGVALTAMQTQAAENRGDILGLRSEVAKLTIESAECRAKWSALESQKRSQAIETLSPSPSSPPVPAEPTL
jgi:hypothetical protein